MPPPRRREGPPPRAPRGALSGCRAKSREREKSGIMNTICAKNRREGNGSDTVFFTSGKDKAAFLPHAPQHDTMTRNPWENLSKPFESQVNIWGATIERVPLLFHQAGRGKRHFCLWRGGCRRPWTESEPWFPEDHPFAWCSADKKRNMNRNRAHKENWIRKEMIRCLSRNKTLYVHFDHNARVHWEIKLVGFFLLKKDERIFHSGTKWSDVGVDETQTSSRPVVPEKPRVRAWLLMKKVCGSACWERTGSGSKARAEVPRPDSRSSVSERSVRGESAESYRWNTARPRAGRRTMNVAWMEKERTFGYGKIKHSYTLTFEKGCVLQCRLSLLICKRVPERTTSLSIQVKSIWTLATVCCN